MISATAVLRNTNARVAGSGIMYPPAAVGFQRIELLRTKEERSSASRKRTNYPPTSYLLSYTMEHLAECFDCTNQDVEAGIDTSLFSHRERRLSNLMFSRKRQNGSADPPLFSGDIDTLGEIRSDLELQGKHTSLSDSEIVDLALRLMRRDLRRGLEAEVLEEVRREADYRQWCASIDGVPEKFVPADSLPRNGGSK